MAKTFLERFIAGKGGSLALGDSDKDNEFSWRACDVCASKLGGARHDASIITRKRGKVVADKVMICTDCLMFHANGDLPEEY